MVENCRTDTSTSYRKALVKEVTTLTEKNSPKKLCEKTQTQMFSCEFCEKFKTTCFTEQLQITASVSNSYLLYLSLFKNLFTFFFSALHKSTFEARFFRNHAVPLGSCYLENIVSQ